MPLTPAEEARLQKYIDSYNISEALQKRIRQIAEMSNDGYTLGEIKKSVIGTTEFISGTRMKLRRAGVW